MNTSGIFYIPTKSFDEVSNPNSGQFEGILQQHFICDHQNSPDATSDVLNYLEIPLNQLREENSNHLDKRYNTIIVDGFAMQSPNSSNINNSYFRHIWLTDWNISDNFESNLGFDSFENSADDSTTNEYDPPGTSFISAVGSECVNPAPNDDWFTANDEVVGWSKKSGSTGSGGTGPNGGCDSNGNPINSPNSSLHYIYTETSSPFNDGDHVMIVRSRPINFSNLMSDTSNQLNLVYNVHRFGNGMGNLTVYIDTNPQSTNADATVLDLMQGQQQLTSGQAYSTRTINLNAYREIDDFHYIYFVYRHTNTSAASSFKGDCAIDNVKVVEIIDGLNEGSSFTMTSVGGGGSGAIALALPSLVINETTQTPVIRFSLRTSKKLYIKGSYLLM